MAQAPAMTNTNDTIETDEKLDKLERFIARRFDEISMEIEATSQLMEMAEEDAGKRFQDMLGMLNAISFAGDGTSPANSGMELKTVVKETENAATEIMDAADHIKVTLDSHEDLLANDMALATFADKIHQDVQRIILACGFQDLVSQRVTTSIENIEAIQERLASTLEKFGIAIPEPTAQPPMIADNHTTSETLSSQDDVDALFD
jgi:chemotaxis regulatin CheY-phosphate phosphatase CheZ